MLQRAQDTGAISDQTDRLTDDAAKPTQMLAASPVDSSDLTWLISLVRDFWVLDRVEDGLLVGADVGVESLRGAVDGDGR